MSRARATYLVAMIALCNPGSLAAESIPSDLRQMLEAVEREETAEHYAAAYVRIKQVARLAKEQESAAALERIDELEPFLESSARRQVSDELDRYVRAQAASNPELIRQLGPPSEPSVMPECAYDEDARNFVCRISLEGGAFQCVAGEGALRCGRE